MFYVLMLFLASFIMYLIEKYWYVIVLIIALVIWMINCFAKKSREIHEYNFQNQCVNFDNLDGHTFEHFCADVLSHNGFSNITVTRGSGDYGTDIIAHKDGMKYAIQCKCYSSNVGNKAVQEVYSGKAFYKADVAIVMTNRYFTNSAIKQARACGVVLWDRDKLKSLVRASMNNQM